MSELLRLDAISKSFGGLHALSDVTFNLREGEVLALVGDNGAGKSTLMKIVAGVHAPTSGRLYFEGDQVVLNRPAEARVLGIETVFQDLALVETQDTTTNMFLGREETTRFGFLDKKTMREQAGEILAQVSINVPSPRALVRRLSGGQRQAVAIGRATAFGARVLLMDEPTAALGVQETDKVLEMVRDLRRAGITVVIVSHSLDQVLDISDRVAVLRRGRLVDIVATEKSSGSELVGLITGATDGKR
ncbi:ATP-binding cassette domain-containing protein [Candidatus Poriferisocius sp.]|uniref:ATP-binding cassette domain-containing protein n=1 Tax=Candidatus Poriferisocius sp. TaxID=3101276 RepID=UPI003B01DCC4